MPKADVPLKDWAVNFSALITATPANYNLVAGDATAIDTVVDAYTAALVLTTNPATRTPVTIAAKDAAREAMRTVVMPYATTISQDAAVSDGLKTGVGVTVRSTIRTRNEVLTVSSDPFSKIEEDTVRIGNFNPATPDSNARPLGALGWEVQIEGNDNVAVPAWELVYNATITRPSASIDQSTVGSHIEYRFRARWCGALLVGGGPNCGPWSSWRVLPVPSDW